MEQNKRERKQLVVEATCINQFFFLWFCNSPIISSLIIFTNFYKFLINKLKKRKTYSFRGFTKFSVDETSSFVFFSHIFRGISTNHRYPTICVLVIQPQHKDALYNKIIKEINRIMWNKTYPAETWNFQFFNNIYAINVI